MPDCFSEAGWKLALNRSFRNDPRNVRYWRTAEVRGNVAYWHISDVARLPLFDRFRGHSGHQENDRAPSDRGQPAPRFRIGMHLGAGRRTFSRKVNSADL
jgi:hypothetical protein